MEKHELLSLIEALSNGNGVSGFEEEVVGVLRQKSATYGAIHEDSMRNLYIEYAQNTRSRPVVMLDAHSDEVGYMVQAIKPNGTMTFLPLGSMVPANICAQKVRIRNRLGQYIPGIISSKPPHYLSEQEKNAPVLVANMTIDVGASSREEVLEDYQIGVGAPVVPDVDFCFDGQRNQLLGKGFDCRLGCAALLQTMDLLQNTALQVDVKAAFSVQEEVGTRGATVTVKRCKPDVAIVFEGCPADDTFGEAYAMQTMLKKGPMLRHIDARMITNPRFMRFALDIAEELDIPVQEGVRSGGGTNGAVIHLSNEGIPTIVIGVPVRYIHTHYGFAHYYDVEHSAKLAANVVQRLIPSIIASF